MTKKKHYFGGMLAMLTTLLMVGCFVNDNPVRTSLEVDTSNLVLSIGESATRSASSKASEAEITYSSSKPAVATVDQKGKVTGVSEGEATITISMPEARKSWYAAKTISYKVIVKNVSATALKNVDKTTPLTLVATEDGKITVYFMNGITLANDIKYTINGGAEKTIAKNTEGSYDIVVKKGDVVQLYSNNTSLGGGGGVGARGMTRAIDSGAKFINIKPSMKTEIYGNVMSLLKGKDNLASANSIEGNNAFYGLFAGADKLVNSPERNLVLPATSLKQGCYQDMFSGCKGIEKAPELPAPTLVKDCYSGMFADCSKLSAVKCLATDASADGCVKDWLEGAGKEAETTPVVETVKGSNLLTIPDAIPSNFTKVVAISKITVEPTSLTMRVGEKATLKATVDPVEAKDSPIEWFSDDMYVATVNDKGEVTAVSAGSTKITVSTPEGGVFAVCEVNVKAEESKPDVTSLIVGKWLYEFKSGYVLLTLKENGTGNYYEWDNSRETNKDLTYVMRDGVITIDRGNGPETATIVSLSVVISSGKEEIELQLKGWPDSGTWTWKKVADDYKPQGGGDEPQGGGDEPQGGGDEPQGGGDEPQGGGDQPQGNILVTDIWTFQDLSLSSSSSTGLNYSIYPDNATNKSVAFTSDNPSVVSVNENGDLSTHGITGVAHITVSAKDGSGVSATCTVTVKTLGRIYFETKEVNKTAGSSPFINPLTRIGDGTVTFSSSNINVASVNSATGEVTIAPGATAGQTVVIQATVSESETNGYIYYDFDTSKTASYTVKVVSSSSQAEMEGFSPGSW